MVERTELCEPPSYIPKWDGVFEGWARNFVKKNYWRVSDILTYNEALQECATKFAQVIDRNRGKPSDPPEFMAAFQIAVINRFNTLSVKNTHNRELKTLNADIEYLLYPQSTPADSAASANLAGASEELWTVLDALFNAPRELRELMYFCQVPSDSKPKTREFVDLESLREPPRDKYDRLWQALQECLWSRHLLKMCGLRGAKHNVIGELRKMLIQGV
jgi:hypothetical protein